MVMRNLSESEASKIPVPIELDSRGLFPTQRSSLCLLHWQEEDSLLLSHQESPGKEGGWFILENTGFLAAPKHPHRDANWKFRFESQKPQGQCYVKGETEDSTASM